MDINVQQLSNISSGSTERLIMHTIPPEQSLIYRMCLIPVRVMSIIMQMQPLY